MTRVIFEMDHARHPPVALSTATVLTFADLSASRVRSAAEAATATAAEAGVPSPRRRPYGTATRSPSRLLWPTSSTSHLSRASTTWSQTAGWSWGSTPISTPQSSPVCRRGYCSTCPHRYDSPRSGIGGRTATEGAPLDRLEDPVGWHPGWENSTTPPPATLTARLAPIPSISPSTTAPSINTREGHGSRSPAPSPSRPIGWSPQRVPRTPSSSDTTAHNIRLGRVVDDTMPVAVKLRPALSASI